MPFALGSAALELWACISDKSLMPKLPMLLLLHVCVYMYVVMFSYFMFNYCFNPLTHNRQKTAFLYSIKCKTENANARKLAFICMPLYKPP